MESDLWLEVLGKYGITGTIILVIVFLAAWMVYKMAFRAIDTSEKKDADLKEINHDVLDVIRNNTHAHHELATAMTSIESTLEGVVKHLTQCFDRNTDEHDRILDKISSHRHQ